jgi:hypothetical protein
MWVKVDDRFPDHRKVFSAGAHLGPHSTGRVLAIWLEAMCWTNYNKTDGFLPVETVRTFKHDRHPLKVAAAMVRECRRPDGTMGPGLWVEADGGFSVHDYGDHNDREKFSRTSAARAEAGRAGGVKSGEARRYAKAKQLLRADDSNAEASPNPVPVTQLQNHKSTAPVGAESTDPVEKSPDARRGLSVFDRREIAKSWFAGLSDGEQHSKLCALVTAELEGGGLDPDADDGDQMAHLKDIAARAKYAPVTGEKLRKALDSVLTARGLKVGA